MKKNVWELSKTASPLIFGNYPSSRSVNKYCLTEREWNLSLGKGTNQIATFSDISGSSKECITFGDLPYGGMTYTVSGASNKCVKYSLLQTADFSYTVVVSGSNTTDYGTLSALSQGTRNWSASGTQLLVLSSDSSITVNGTCTQQMSIRLTGLDSSNKFTINSKSAGSSVGVNIANQASISLLSSTSTSATCQLTISITKGSITKSINYHLYFNKTGGSGGIVGPERPDERL